MTILIINWRDITHPWAGGAERHLYELAKQWVLKKHKVILLVGGYRSALRKETRDGIEIIRIGNTYSIFLLAPIYYLLKFKKIKFDCVIDTAHGIPFFTPLYITFPKILIIHHNHKKLWETEFGTIVSKIGVFLEDKIVPRLYKKISIVTLSKTERKLLEQMGFENVLAIPPGIDNHFFCNNRKKSNIPIVLYLGRLRKYKRVDILFNIFAEIKKNVPKVKLIIAGNGQDRIRLEQIARRVGIGNEVIFKGLVSEDEKLKLLQQAWVLAAPSLVEGWGLVATEAASCGTPTVGFNVPGIADAVKHNTSGLLSGDKKGFTKDLIKVLKDHYLRSRLSKGAKEWSEKTTWKRAAENFLQIIKKESQKNNYNESYFSSFWRSSYKRNFHPVCDFRIWYILKFLKPSNLIDVGCGTGIVIAKLREKGIKAYGVDISKAALSITLPKIKKYCFFGDILKLPLKTRGFDVVSCIDVLEHIKKDELKRAIGECARIAKRAIYFDTTGLEDIFFIHSDNTHVSKFFSWQWHRILKEVLGKEWKVSRGPILPFIHHGIFIAERVDHLC